MNTVMKAAKHSAPGPYLGFALQPVRLCYHLLSCQNGAAVSLEYLDDIAIHGADGSILLEQTKSALKQNPLSDWANDLWKTIDNWLHAIEENSVDLERTQFRLYVTPIRTGSIAQALSAATSAGDVADLVVRIKGELKAMRKPPTAYVPFVKHFLEAAEKHRVGLVTRLTVVSADEDPVEPLRKLLAPTVAPHMINLICSSVIGQAKEEADRLLRAAKPALIDAEAFRTGFIAFIQKNNLPGYLTSFTDPPQAGEVEAMLSRRPTFIRQLEIIEVTTDERVRAVSDYLRTAADKSVWAEAGLIFEKDLRDWDDGLIRHHGHICGEIFDVYANVEPHIRGRIAYRRCCQMQAAPNGRVVPGHFVHGCLQELADLLRLGWHPNYTNLLSNSQE